MNKNLVDIIVPIYNAYDDLLECIESIFINSNKDTHRLILINDKSSDLRIEDYLHELREKKISNVIILENESNLGFVKTVNKGINYSNHDVILLNSDTIVTRRWLEKLESCAYFDESIATVTPFTNSGTICSIPEFCEDNNIPENFTIDSFADMIEKISFKQYPIIPTGVGFCMYIKRSVINKIGFLDEVNFNKGYGEENDFCCRAIEHGYINVLCDDTFIYHKGSMSFKEEKRKYIEENSKVLGKKYPYYFPKVEKFIKDNPLKNLQQNIKMNIGLHNNKKNILYVLHNGILESKLYNRGGTEFHVNDLVKNNDEFNKFVMYSNGKELFVNAFVNSNVFNFKFDIGQEITLNTFNSYRYEQIVKKILLSFNINIIHIHHLKNHTFDIIDLAKKFRIPIVITLHDFYSICPTINLLDDNGVYCEGIRSEEKCLNCIKNKFGYDTNFLKLWNENIKIQLKRFDEIYTPSYSAKKVIEDYYNDLDLNIKVIEHGVDSTVNFKKTKNSNKLFRVAFIGGLAPYKGSGIIHDLITTNKNDNIQWYILGNLGDQRLNLLERKDLIKYGRYEREDIYNIINSLEIDLIGIFSIWPETYAYTLTEAWQAGVPVIVNDIGALGERVKKTNAGWAVKMDTSIEGILNLIYKIKEDNKLYEDKLNKIYNMKFKTKKEMADEYVTIYNKLVDKTGYMVDYNYKWNKFIYKAYISANILDTEINSDNMIEIAKRLNELDVEINEMRNTFGWKLLEVIRNRTPHLGKKLKKVLYLFSRKFYK